MVASREAAVAVAESVAIVDSQSCPGLYWAHTSPGLTEVR